MLLRGEFTSDGNVITIGLSVMDKNGKKLRYVTDNPSEATQEHQPDWVLAPRLGPGASKVRATDRRGVSKRAFTTRRDVYSHRR